VSGEILNAAKELRVVGGPASAWTMWMLKRRRDAACSCLNAPGGNTCFYSRTRIFALALRRPKNPASGRESRAKK